MFLIRKENKEKANEIIKKWEFNSYNSMKEELKTIAEKIDKSSLIFDNQYYILEYGTTTANKPDTGYFTWGKYWNIEKYPMRIESIYQSKRQGEKIYFDLGTAWGNKIAEYAIDDLTLMEKE